MWAGGPAGSPWFLSQAPMSCRLSPARSPEFNGRLSGSKRFRSSISCSRFRSPTRAPCALVFPGAGPPGGLRIRRRAQQVRRDPQPVARRYTSRDLRGHLVASDAMHVSSFVGGIRCDGSWNPSFSVECRENASQQWPVGTVSWTVNPARNYFSGQRHVFERPAGEDFPLLFFRVSLARDDWPELFAANCRGS